MHAVIAASEFGYNLFLVERHLTHGIVFHLGLTLKQLIRSKFSITDSVLVSSKEFTFPKLFEEEIELPLT